MARQRFIWPSLWSSEQIGELSYGARLLFIGIFSLADDEGRIKASSKFLRVQIFPYDDGAEIEKWKREIQEKKLAQFYHVGEEEFVFLPTWEKYQKPKYPRPSSIPPPSLGEPSFILGEVFPKPSPNPGGKEKEENPPLKNGVDIEEEENSGNLPGTLGESSGNVPLWDGLGRDGLGRDGKDLLSFKKKEAKKPSEKSFLPESEKLCLLFLELSPKITKKPDSWENYWLEPMEALLRIDKKDPTEVEELIRWVKADTPNNHPGEKWPGWATQVKSPAKFRKIQESSGFKYYDVLIEKMEEAKNKPTDRRAPSSKYREEDWG